MTRRRSVFVFALAAVTVLAIGASTFAASTAPREVLTSPDDMTLYVVVDNSICATGVIQCTVQSDHTSEFPAPENHNPVRLGIQVLNGFESVSGLRFRDFHVAVHVGPGGSGPLTKLKCADCFREAAAGIYVLFVHPSPGAALNWRSGAYLTEISVDVGDVTLRTLVQIEIPFEKK